MKQLARSIQQLLSEFSELVGYTIKIGWLIWQVLFSKLVQTGRKFVAPLTSVFRRFGSHATPLPQAIRHKLPFTLRNWHLMASGSTIALAALATLIITNSIALPKLSSREPAFRRTPLSSWTYTATSPTGDIESHFRTRNNQAQVQVSRRTGGAITGQTSSVIFATSLNNPQLNKLQDNLVYETANNLISVQYQILPNGIKEDIMLTDEPLTNEFSSQIVLKNLSPRLSADQQLYFVNDDEEYQFHLEKPFAYDASGSKTYGVRYKLLRTPPDEQREEPVYSNPLDVFANTITGSTSKEILGATQTPITDQQTYRLVLEVDPAWLNNPNRQYPIIIDPTVIHDESSEFGGEKNQIKDFGSGVSPQLEATYQELTADSQTAALWHLENSWNDSSSGGSHATANNGATFSTNNPVGSYGGEFDGNNDYAVTNSVSGPTQQVTIEAWVRPDTLSGDDKGLVIKQNQLSLEIETDNNCIDFAVYNTNTSGWEELQPTNCALPEGKWSHLAATYDGTTLRVYQNGVEVGSQSGNGLVMNNTTNPYYLGYNPFYGTRYLDGGLDEVRVSYVARTAEEIRAAAQRYPSAVYTSNVIDLGAVSSLDSFAWEEAGVATGDGETLFNTTGLVAQWNFNETSGPTASNSQGNSSLDGTLTNFSNTSGQDVAPGSGWTSTNRKWGAGALMFDGSNDYVALSDDSSLNTTTTTIEAWINPADFTAEAPIYNRRTSGNVGGVTLEQSGYNGLIFYAYINGGWRSVYSGDNSIQLNTWQHVAGTYDGASLKVYIDGKLMATTNYAGTINNPTSPLVRIGGNAAGTNFFHGVIDSVRIYNRSATAAEIAANAQAGQLEMQTRTSADGSSWSSWTPATGNTQIESFDAASTTYDDISVRSTLYPADSTGLQHYWAFDEAVDNSCSGGEDACDSTGSNHLIANGNSNIVSGVYKNGRYFDGSGDTLSDTNFSIPAQGTVTFWMVPQPDSTRQRIFGSLDNFEFNIESGNILSNQLGAAGSDALNSSTVLNSGQLYFVAATYDTVSTNQMTIYLDGQLDSSSSQADDNPSGTQTFTIGTRTGSTNYYTGMLDEFRFYNSVLDGTAIQALYEQSAPQNHHVLTENDTVIKQEGASSNKISAGLTVASDTTTGLWHLDETNGDLGGADVFDSSINGYDGEFTGSSIATNVVDGVIDMARGFNGSDDRIDFSSSATIANSSTYTISAWFKADSASTTEGNIYGEGNTGTDTPLVMLKVNNNDVDGDLRYIQRGDGNTSVGLTLTDQDYSDNQWHHVVVVRTSASDFEMFVDGRSKGTFSGSPGTTTVNVATLGALHRTSTSSFFDGAIDEVFTSTIALTADEVTELYRLGKGHSINYNLSSTNLSSSKYLPVYVAADKPGNYLQAILGESEFANNQPDANTIGLWHMNDDWTDSSSNNYNATPNGNAAFTTNSRLGSSAGLFDGTGDYLNVGDIDSIDTATNLSGCAWVNHATDTADQEIFSKSNSTNDGFLFFRDEAGSQSGRTDTYTIYLSDGTDSDSVRIEGATNAAPANQWNYVCFTFQAGSSTGLHLYVNGVEDPNSPVSTTSITNVNSTTNNFVIGATSQIAAFFDGSIDEVHLFDRILSAAEIRQAYEIGDRTHQIPINFAAHLNSSNLISDSNDTSFTIDATTRGFTMAGAHLYPEEKVIVKENSGGTEYIAQGIVSSITHSSGAVTVDSWDTGSTFPSGGFTANAMVFKWQRFFLDISTVFDQFQDGVDLLTLQVTDNHQGRTVWIDDLEKSTGALSNPAGESISSPTNRYFQYRMTTTNHDANISPQLTSVTLDYTDNSLPSSPILDDAYLPDNTALPDTTPELRFTSTDGEGDDLVYQVQVDTDADFASATSYTSDTASGFTNIDSGGDTSPFTSGNKISYTFQSALTNDTTYFYRVRAIDPSGTNTYSNWSSIRSMTINTSSSRGWHQTHADQFETNTNTEKISVNHTNNNVVVTSSSSDYSYKKSITITNSGSQQSNYDALIEIDTASLISASKMQSDCDDMRFKNSDDSTNLTYYLESGCNTSSTQIWVEIPTLPSGNHTIYLYYDNPSATSNSQTWSGTTILPFSGSCPTGWSQVSTLNASRYMYGSTSTYGTTGGSSANHTHAISGNSSTVGNGGHSDGGCGWGTEGHYHPYSINSDGATVEPPYVNVNYCSYSGLPNTLDTSTIGMFDNLPSGWSSINQNQRFPRGSNTPVGTGGSATHSHTYSGDTGNNNTPDRTISCNYTASGNVWSPHWHGFSGTTSAPNSLPPYRDVIGASPVSTSTFKGDFIIGTNTTTAPPLGWSLNTALNDKFPRFNSSSGGTGGSTTHSHSWSFTTSSILASAGVYRSSDGGSNRVGYHTHTGSGTTGTVSNIPSYMKTIFMQRTTDSTSKSFGNEININQGSTTSPAITAADFSAVKWNQFSFNQTLTTGSISYQILYDNSGTPTLIPDSDLSGNSSGFTTSPVDLSGLDISTYPVLYVRSNITSGDTSPSLDDWTVLFTSTNTPTLSNQYLPNYTIQSDLTPELRFTTTNNSNEDLVYQIQWDTDDSFPSPSSATSDTNNGFANVDNGGDTSPFTSGDSISYTFQSDLSNTTTYFYRVRAKDPGGTNSYSAWSATHSFTVDTSHYKAWHQTHGDQFDNGTFTGSTYVDYTNNNVKVNPSLSTSLETGDDASQWISSNNNLLTVNQETTIKQEGTGSVHLSPNSSWYATDYSRRKIITLSNSSGSTLTDYQVRLAVSYDDNMQDDFDDLRFYNSSGAQLNYWRESYSSASSAVIWVKVNSISNGSATTIHMYYGNSSASTASSVSNTFLNNQVHQSIGTCNNATYCGGMDNHSEADYIRANYSPSTNRYDLGFFDDTGGDYFYRRYRFLYVPDQTGTFRFGLTSDDASEVVISQGDSYGGGYLTGHPFGAHTVIAHWYGLHGGGACGDANATVTSVSMTAGEGYWMEYLMNEWTGGNLAHMCVKEPSSSNFYTVDINNNPDQLYARKYTSGAEPTGSFGSEETIIGQTATRTLTSTDLSSYDVLKFYVRSSITGQYMRFQFGESSSSENTFNFFVNSANTWEQKSFDISSIPAANRDAITKLALYVTNSSSDFDFYFDNLTGSFNGGTITSPLITADHFYTDDLAWEKLTFNDDQTGGVVTYQILYDADGTPTLIPDSQLTNNSTGFTSSPVNISNLSTDTYPSLYVRATLNNDTASPALNDWTIHINLPPHTPNLNRPTNTQANVQLTPNLSTTATDPDSDSVQYKIELCTDAAMTANCQTFDQTSSQTGWSNQNAESNTMYVSGDQATYTPTTPLNEGTTYYWRSYAIDPNGTNTWSATQDPPHSFTTILYAPAQCIIRETSDDSHLTLEWTDDSNGEINYEIERDVSSAGFAALITKPANSTSHQDTNISKTNTYQYRVRATGPDTNSNWCTTSMLDLGSVPPQNIELEGLQLEGLQVN